MKIFKYTDEAGNVFTDSLSVAAVFGRHHRNILASIRKCIEAMDDKLQFGFIPTTYRTKKGNTAKYLLDKEACDFLISSMGGAWNPKAVLTFHKFFAGEDVEVEEEEQDLSEQSEPNGTEENQPEPEVEEDNDEQDSFFIYPSTTEMLRTVVNHLISHDERLKELEGKAKSAEAFRDAVTGRFVEINSELDNVKILARDSTRKTIDEMWDKKMRKERKSWIRKLFGL